MIIKERKIDINGKVAADLAVADHFLYEKRAYAVEKLWKGRLVPDL